MQIVSMTAEHVSRLAELEKLCFSEPWSEKSLTEEIDNPAACFLVAMQQDEVLGYGGMPISKIAVRLRDEFDRVVKEPQVELTTDQVKLATPRRLKATGGVIVDGEEGCVTKFARCCNPLPGDEIIGFVTRGFGVSIHKRDCANARESMRHPENADRWVRAYWDEAEKENYKATLDIVCIDRANLVSDVALALGDMRVPIYSLTARAAEQGRARMSVTVGITNTEHLNSVVARLKKIKDVVSVTRN